MKKQIDVDDWVEEKPTQEEMWNNVWKYETSHCGCGNQHSKQGESVLKKWKTCCDRYADITEDNP